MAREDGVVVPGSLLDTDLYKFTMQQAVLHHFPDAQATYKFTHRDKDVFFTRQCFDLFKESVSHFDEVSMTDAEYTWLSGACPYFSKEYLDYLKTYRFKPSQVTMSFVPTEDNAERGQIEILATGLWTETILWEVPLMACLSEIYFRTADTDWSYDGQEEQAYEKARIYLEAGCVFSEFGTRRRRSYHIQDLVVGTLIRADKDFHGRGKLMGTSNVHLAMKHNVAPIGTIAHEWFMGIAVLKGYEYANGKSLDLWEEVYPNVLLLALTDTFSTEIFYKDFVQDKARAERWKGLRQDSGDPYVYAPRAKEIYESLGIDYHQKTIIFSDAVNVEKALKLQKQCDEIGFKASFGIGTSLTNDFKSLSSGGKKKSRALNMVIKLNSINGEPCVKISDELAKNTGLPAAVKRVKEIYHINA
ncbi:nicotinate phosphoribosyltransferase [Irpex rosettiformis]|uniref:Nicotinate phosphoribosyltransferase n=1 Tax=Irpex rosettiformis TaxID=378272 RepID=A0ACB8TR93_9APHY|nr:nicotinate phosphoribosyltransferase [Irpex rosettiformis]